MNKTISTLAISALLTVFSISACKKKESQPAPSTNSTTTTGGTTGGTTTGGAVISYSESAIVNVDSANAVLYTTNPGSGNQREIDIYAFKGGNQVLEFHFLPKTGTQPVAQNFSSAWLTFMTNNGMNFPGDYYNCTSGNFNLTTCDTVTNKIIGTFDFIGNNGTTNKNITSGTINITKIKKQ